MSVYRHITRQFHMFSQIRKPIPVMLVKPSMALHMLIIDQGFSSSLLKKKRQYQSTGKLRRCFAPSFMFKWGKLMQIIDHILKTSLICVWYVILIQKQLSIAFLVFLDLLENLKCELKTWNIFFSYIFAIHDSIFLRCP